MTITGPSGTITLNLLSGGGTVNPSPSSIYPGYYTVTGVTYPNGYTKITNSPLKVTTTGATYTVTFAP